MADEVLEAFKEAGYIPVEETSNEGERPEGGAEGAGKPAEGDAGSAKPGDEKPQGDDTPGAGDAKPVAEPKVEKAAEPGAEKPESKPAEEPAKAPTILEMSGGKYTTVEEMMAAIKESQEQASLYKPVNAKVEALNNFLREGGTEKDFNRIYSVDAEKAEDLDVLKAVYKLKNPTSDESDEDIEAVLKDQYKLDPDAEYTPTAKRAAEVNMKRDVNDGRKFLTEKQKQIAVPSRAQYNPEQHLKQFEPLVKEIVSSVKSVQFLLDGKDETLTYDIPEKVMLAGKAYIEGEIKASGIAPGEGVDAKIKATLENYYKLNLMGEIVKDAAKKGGDKVNREWIAKGNNPSALHSKSDQDPRPKSTGSKEEQLAEHIMRIEGIQSYKPQT